VLNAKLRNKTCQGLDRQGQGQKPILQGLDLQGQGLKFGRQGQGLALLLVIRQSTEYVYDCLTVSVP